MGANTVGTLLTGAGTAVLGLAAAWAAFKAIPEYRARVRADEARARAEKARWMSELFHGFYEDRTYRAIRQRIDYGDISDILNLTRRAEGSFSQQERDLLDNFTDYLNFFEYMMYLVERQQLDSSDIEAMFDYYLRSLAQRGELSAYAKNNGFERLSRMLLKYTKQ